MISPLIDAGEMPNLARLIENGVMGNLATPYPVLSPMLWTSIATGKRAYKHGIHGFSEPDPASGGARTITNLGRKTKPVWNQKCLCSPGAWGEKQGRVEMGYTAGAVVGFAAARPA